MRVGLVGDGEAVMMQLFGLCDVCKDNRLFDFV